MSKLLIFQHCMIFLIDIEKLKIIQNYEEPSYATKTIREKWKFLFVGFYDRVFTKNDASGKHFYQISEDLSSNISQIKSQCW